MGFIEKILDGKMKLLSNRVKKNCLLTANKLPTFQWGNEGYEDTVAHTPHPEVSYYKFLVFGDFGFAKYASASALLTQN